MAAAATMDHLHDRRLSVSKSSCRISKPSSSSAPSAPRAASSSSSSSSSRPADTVVSANLSNFRRVVQQLTGSPPPSAASSPLRDPPPPPPPPPTSSRSSRLHRLAPRPLRDSFRPSSVLTQNQQLQPIPHHHHLQHSLDPPPLLHQQQQNYHHHHHARINAAPEAGGTHQLHDFSWLETAGMISPLFPYTQAADAYQNSGSKPPPYPPPIPPPQSPHLFSALPPLTPTDSMWAYTASPRPFSNSAGPLSPLSPLPSERVRDPGSGSGGHGLRNEASEGWELSKQSGDGYGVLHMPSNGSPLLPSSSPGHLLLPASFNENPPPFSSGKEKAQLGPSQTGSHPLLITSSAPSLPPVVLPLSPSTASFNPWSCPWPPSPFMALSFPPGLFPPSPGIGSVVSSPRGYLFCGNDYPPKLP